MGARPARLLRRQRIQSRRNPSVVEIDPKQSLRVHNDVHAFDGIPRMHETCSGNVVRASERELAAATIDDISQIISWNYLQNGGGDMASSYRAGQCFDKGNLR